MSHVQPTVQATDGPSVACTVGCTWLMYSLCTAYVWPTYDICMTYIWYQYWLYMAIYWQNMDGQILKKIQ